MTLVELAQGVRLATNEKLYQSRVGQAGLIMIGRRAGHRKRQHLRYSRPETKRFTHGGAL